MNKKIFKLLNLIFILMIFSVMSLTQTNVHAANSDSMAGVVSLTSGNLNVRKTASAKGSIMTFLPKGNYVTLMSKSGSWWYVEYEKGKYGYCHSDYIKTVSSSPVSVQTNSGNLNVRRGAGSSYSIKDTLERNTIVLSLSSSGNWTKILYNGGKTGYVSSDYLKASYSSVKLSVPNFKQTDSRWANVKIGNSGKTISQIGCATTGIAMMESFRSGKNIYPDEMSKKLTYSSSGNLYWPSDYTVVTDSSAYLRKIYAKLKEGKPVLIGAKKSSGSQHWVVITGFKGGTSLKASSFTINDPGSTSRTNLQQFLDIYPYFYKYFYY